MSVLVRVPASTSNLGAGFDCVGIAVSRWLQVTAYVESEAARDVTIERSGTLRSSIVAVAPRDPAAAVGGAMVRAWRGVGVAAESFTVLERVGGCATKSLPIRRQPISRAEA